MRIWLSRILFLLVVFLSTYRITSSVLTLMCDFRGHKASHLVYVLPHEREYFQRYNMGQNRNDKSPTKSWHNAMIATTAVISPQTSISSKVHLLGARRSLPAHDAS